MKAEEEGTNLSIKLFGVCYKNRSSLICMSFARGVRGGWGREGSSSTVGEQRNQVNTLHYKRWVGALHKGALPAKFHSRKVFIFFFFDFLGNRI